MIRLRRWIDCTLERRWLGPLVLLVLVLLLAFVALHSLSDHILESAALVCTAVALFFSVAVTLLAAPAVRRLGVVVRGRAPPPRSSALIARALATRHAPLRL